ncbi:hypothetical protein ABPG77_006970 [Micractinium sp. CCAP 211/92]
MPLPTSGTQHWACLAQSMAPHCSMSLPSAAEARVTARWADLRLSPASDPVLTPKLPLGSSWPAWQLQHQAGSSIAHVPAGVASHGLDAYQRGWAATQDWQ